MNELLIRELNEERKELGIDSHSFVKIVALAEVYGREHPEISEEEIGIIARETINSYDYGLDSNEEKNEIDEYNSRAIYRKRKNINQCFETVLINLGYEQRTPERRI